MQDLAVESSTSSDSGRTDPQQHKATTTTIGSPKQASPPTAQSPSTSNTPDDLGPFDWEEFEVRYKKALEEADGHEMEILKEFDNLTQYFNTWARASSAHDDERAIKRLHTRQRFVAQSEERMAQKQQHYNDVLKAFQNALALLKEK